MKRVFPVLLACLLLLGLTACGAAIELPEETQAVTDTAEPEITTQVVEAEFPTQPAEPEFTTKVVEAMIDPDFDAEALFKRLEGVWDDDYEYPGFMSFIYKDNKSIMYSGVYDGEANRIGTLIGGNESANEGIATLYFQYPAYNGVDDLPVPERNSAVQINLTGIDDGELRILHDSIWGNNGWRTYVYHCKTLQEAGIRATF